MSFVNFLISLLYGLVEGITEWLPVSSTGHMILLDSWFDVVSRFGGTTQAQAFWELFLVVIQLGAILAVIIIFWNKLFPFGKNKEKEEKKRVWITWKNVLIACIPVIFFGIIDKVFDLEEYLYKPLVVAFMLILYGILFIVIEIFNKKREFKIHDVVDMSWKMALIVGLAQVLALVPGTSRSGVTILAAMLLLCDRKTAAEFTFFLSIPVMFGASLLQVVSFIHDGYTLTLEQSLFLLFGCLSAFIVSIVVIKFLLKFINTHNFTAFGVYRIVLGIAVIIYFASTNQINGNIVVVTNYIESMVNYGRI